MTAAVGIESLGRAGSALFEAMRPRQWLKNLLLFAGLVFAGVGDEPGRWLRAGTAFAAYSLISSGSYLLNDVRDAPADRLHPVKSLRPVARGALQPEVALAFSALLVAAGLGAAAALNDAALELAVGFGALQLLYTLVLKRVVLVDVVVIAGLFVIRAAAGAQAVHVFISPWLLACTALLALFLGLAKRRGELVLAGRGDAPGRAALRGYTIPTLDSLLTATVLGTVGTYGVYAVAYAPHTRWMALTLPFVLVGLGRYLRLVRSADLGEEPESVLLSDRLLLTTVALWILVASVVIAVR